MYNERTGVRETIDTLLQGELSAIWSQALLNEWDRLADGKLKKVKPSHTIEFVTQNEIPRDRKSYMETSFAIFAPSKKNHIESA